MRKIKDHNRDTGIGGDIGRISHGTYPDGREYQLITTYNPYKENKIMRRGKRKDGTWTEWYYAPINYYSESELQEEF